ncbi:hypothetical protein LCGC14_1583800 [marine sediment metagenome]|uniref:Uncharacterized protein n=1 Tax=marine sediment metagenome TaxID=412755 RepID=A0A0F9KWS4_9ZZZZ
MDWAKFERMAELYGGGTKPKKRKSKHRARRKSKKSLKWRDVSTIEFKGKPLGFRNY